MEEGLRQHLVTCAIFSSWGALASNPKPSALSGTRFHSSTAGLSVARYHGPSKISPSLAVLKRDLKYPACRVLGFPDTLHKLVPSRLHKTT